MKTVISISAGLLLALSLAFMGTSVEAGTTTNLQKFKPMHVESSGSHLTVSKPKPKFQAKCPQWLAVKVAAKNPEFKYAGGVAQLHLKKDGAGEYGNGAYVVHNNHMALMCSYGLEGGTVTIISVWVN